MPLLETKGAGSAQGFGLSLGSAIEAVYIEEVFSCFLYTGNGSTQTITNGIDLDGEGGLVWGKNRGAVNNNFLINTVLGSSNGLVSNLNGGNTFDPNRLTAFTSSGFSVGTSGSLNTSSNTYVSWTFRKQPKFFDIVTYTGNGASTRNIAHSLGSIPGFIIVKRTDTAGDWCVAHRSTPAVGLLNTTAAFSINLSSGTPGYNGYVYTSSLSTETTFYVATGENGNSNVNASGGTYVAYLFAHDAGGFGPSGTDNVISCGSFTTDGSSNATVNLGYEPQWVLIKSTDNSDSWFILDNMRGWVTGGNDARLLPNTSGAEAAGNYGNITATGFQANGAYYANSNHIYIAIRRGPMEVPTSGTEVYTGTTRTGTGASAAVTGVGFPPDLVITRNRPSNASSRFAWYDKLRGATRYLDSAATDSEFTVAESLKSFDQDGETLGTGAISNANGDAYINWQLRRAPGFFDEVCYTGTGVARTVAHNLAAVPELMIIKNRSVAGRYWAVYSANRGVSNALSLNQNSAEFSGTSSWNGTAPTNSVFTVNTHTSVNESGATYVAYLFATLAGVSKVGSYTGTGTTQVINCGFTAGARFILIKRTDSTGDWYVWDSARGIVAGNDPYLLLNSAAAEVTNTDFVDTASTGFEISSTAPSAINASGGSFIFLAIA